MGSPARLLFGGSSSTAVPGKSPEELALAREQTELLKLQRAEIEQQARDRNLLMPQLLEASGFRAVKDAQGNITGYEQTEQGLQDAEITRLMRERELAALKGELPVNPGLIRDLDESKRTLEERLRRNLGSGFETSTPGMDALIRAEESRAATLDMARRGDISQMGELLGGRAQIGGQNFAQLFNTGNNALNTAGAFGNAAAGYNQPLSTYLQDRGLTSQIGLANNRLKFDHQKASTSAWNEIARTMFQMGGGKPG